MPTSGLLARYLQLLKGTNLKPLGSHMLALQIASKSPVIKVPPAQLEAAIRSFGHENFKVLGTRAVTGLGLGGAAYGTKELLDDDSIRQRLSVALAKSKTGRLMESLGVKLSEDKSNAKAKDESSSESNSGSKSGSKSKSKSNKGARRRALASTLSLFGASVPQGVSVVAHEAAPKMENRPDLVRKLLALSQSHHTGMAHGPDYAFDIGSRKILSPKGMRGNVPAIAHELAHAHDRLLRGGGRIYGNMIGGTAHLGAAGGVIGAAAMPDRETARNMALLGAATSVPLLGHELYAGIKGMRLLRQASADVPISTLLRTLSGFPTYAAMAAAPLAAYGIRKGLGGFKSDKETEGDSGTKQAATRFDIKDLAERIGVKDLAERIGVKDQVKPHYGRLAAGTGLALAGLAAGVPALRGLVKRVPLYGPAIARQARRAGIVDVIPSQTRMELLARVRGLFENIGIRNENKLNRIMSHVKRHIGVSSASEARKGQVVLEAFSSAARAPRSPRGIGIRADMATRRFADNKLNQMKLLQELGLGHLIPPTLRGKDLLPTFKRLQATGKPFDADDLVKAYYGKRPYIVKDIGNTAGTIINDATVAGRVGSRAKIHDLTPSELVRLFDNAGPDMQDINKLVQGYAPTTKFGPIRRRLYHERSPLGKLRELVFNESLYGKSPPKINEMRVHVVNGKVIPFATSSKWDLFGYFNPFETGRKRRLEAQMQTVFDKIIGSKSPLAKKFKVKDQVFGLDVGFNPKGQPIIYELNPSMPLSQHAGSGQLLMPWVRNAIKAQVKGTLPAAQKLQLAAGGTGLGGGGMLIANNLDRRKD